VLHLWHTMKNTSNLKTSNKYFALYCILLTYSTDRILLWPSFDTHHKCLHPENKRSGCDNRSWSHSLHLSTQDHTCKHNQVNPNNSHGYTCHNTCTTNRNLSLYRMIKKSCNPFLTHSICRKIDHTDVSKQKTMLHYCWKCPPHSAVHTFTPFSRLM
jgi:hypothetical protein